MSEFGESNPQTPNEEESGEITEEMEEYLGEEEEIQSESVLNASSSEPSPPQSVPPPSSPPVSKEITSNDEIGSLKLEIKEIKQQCLRNEEAVKELSGLIGQGKYEEPEQSGKSMELESRLQELSDQIRDMHSALSKQIETVQYHANDIDDGLGLLVERVNVGVGGPDGLSQDKVAIRELYKKVEQIQTDIVIMSNTAAKLMQDSAEKNIQIQNVADKIDNLADLKADREELDEALHDKADLIAMERKVSHEQFHSFLTEISDALHSATTKIDQQEETWHQALDEFEIEIGNKIDKKEMAPLKEFINKKLKNLHNKLKTLSKLRKAEEAAVAKRGLIRDNNCISCDADAVMRTCEELIPLPPAPHPYNNIKPFLSYELDLIRKQKKKYPAKNLNGLENALAKKQTTRPLSEWAQICNRYCGGGHTRTTPSQRVTHVVRTKPCEAPGPEVVQLLRQRASPAANGANTGQNGTARTSNADPRRQSKHSPSTTNGQRRDTYSYIKEMVEKLV